MRAASLLNKAKDAYNSKQPLTTRGGVSLISSLALTKLYAQPESDLLAAIIAESLIVICLISLAISLYLKRKLSSSLEVEAIFDTSNALSKTKISSGLKLKNSSIPPYFHLSIKRKFKTNGDLTSTPISPTHIIKGKEIGEKRLLTDQVVFPHRGIWILAEIELSLGDSLGFTKLTWNKSTSSQIEISAKTTRIKHLPIIASSSQSGDQLHNIQERTGDLFDIKAYDPSDGTKRILWKTFAKSGQLITRRPEPAIVPEGEVAIFLISSRPEDFVAGACQGYIKQLEEENVITLFATDGLFGSSHAETKPADMKISNYSQPSYLSGLGSIIHAINQCVWSIHAGTGKDFATFIEELIKRSKYVRHVVVFLSISKLNTKELRELFLVAENLQIKITLATVKDNSSFNQETNGLGNKSVIATQFLKNFFTKQKSQEDMQNYFLTNTIQSSNIEVFKVEESY
jgi:hypothetical protein